MEISEMINAVDVIYACNPLELTDDDKKLCIFIFNCIIKELGLATTEISVQFALVKVSTWNNSYFCMAARKLCNMLHRYLKVFQTA